MEKKQLDFQAEKIIGVDLEKGDSEVGILGDIFMLGIETENNEIWIDFDNDKFAGLCEILKPFIFEQHLSEISGYEEEIDFLKDNTNTLNREKNNERILELKTKLNKLKLY